MNNPNTKQFEDFDNEPKKEASKEKIKDLKKEEGTIDFLSQKNNQLFENIGAKGKSFFKKAYEGLGLDRTVGKIKIAYDQFWINNNEKKAINLKDKINDIDAKLSTFEKAEKEILSLEEDFKKQGVNSPGSLIIKLKEMDRQKRDLENEKDKAISKFNKHEDRVKLFTNKRDDIANRFIEKYEGKLKPIDKKLDELEESKDELDLAEAINKVTNKDLERKTKESEAKMEKLKETLRATGMLEKEINRFPQIGVFQDLIDGANEKMTNQKRELAQQRLTIDSKIAKANIDYNKENDKIKQFMRIKEDRPIEINEPERTPAREYSDREEITRQKNRNVGEEKQPPTRRVYKDYEYNVEVEEEESEEEEENIEEEEEPTKFTISKYISDWNNYLKETYKEDGKEEVISQKDFIKKTKMDKKYELEYEDFKNILEKYCKLKKKPKDKIEKDMDIFYKEKMLINN